MTVKTAKLSNRPALAMAAAVLVMGAIGYAGNAQARDNVYWSVGVGSPGVSVNLGNAAPVYVQPAPIYYQPAPVYVRPAPIYYQPAPVFVQPRPLYYGPPQVIYVQPGHGKGWKKKHGRDHDDDDDDNHRHGRRYQQGYGQVYYQR